MITHHTGATPIYQHRIEARDRVLADPLDRMIDELRKKRDEGSGHAEGTAAG